MSQIFLRLLLCVGVMLSHPALARAGENNVPTVITQSVTQLLPTLQGAFDQLQSGDLIVFDLDNTVFREVQWLGTDDWYAQAHGQLTERGSSHRRAHALLRPINLRIKSQSKMCLMESGLPKLISSLQARGVKVMGLTARHPELAESTLRNVRELGIDFSLNTLPDGPLRDFRIQELHNEFLWSSGVAFTDGSPKGMVLKALLKRAQIAPEFIVALDDRIQHVHSFVEALLELKISGRVIHYLKALEESFEPEVAELQLVHFKSQGELLSDEDARLKLCETRLRRAK